MTHGPLIVGQDVIFVDTRERRSSQVLRVRIRINIEIAKRDRLSLLAVAAGLHLRLTVVVF